MDTLVVGYDNGVEGMSLWGGVGHIMALICFVAKAAVLKHNHPVSSRPIDIDFLHRKCTNVYQAKTQHTPQISLITTMVSHLPPRSYGIMDSQNNSI